MRVQPPGLRSAQKSVATLARVADASVHEAGDLATVSGSMTAAGADDVARARELKRWDDIRHVLRSKDFESPRPQDGFGVSFQSQVLGSSLVESPRRRRPSIR